MRAHPSPPPGDLGESGSLADLFLVPDGWIWGDPESAESVRLTHTGVQSSGVDLPWRSVLDLRIQTYRMGPHPNLWVRAAHADLFGLGVGSSAVLKTAGRSQMTISTRLEDATVRAPRPLRRYTLAEAIAAEELVARVGSEKGIPREHLRVHADLCALAGALRRRPWSVKRVVHQLLPTR